MELGGGECGFSGSQRATCFANARSAQLCDSQRTTSIELAVRSHRLVVSGADQFSWRGPGNELGDYVQFKCNQSDERAVGCRECQCFLPPYFSVNSRLRQNQMLKSIYTLALGLSLFLSGSFSSHGVVQATYYISPTGSDANNGLTTNTPFATLTKAQAVVRTINSSMTGDI